MDLLSLRSQGNERLILQFRSSIIKSRMQSVQELQIAFYIDHRILTFHGTIHILHMLCPRVGRMWFGWCAVPGTNTPSAPGRGVGHRDLHVGSAASGRLTCINQI